MDIIKLKKLLMQMGGRQCRVSHITRHGEFTLEELDEAVAEGYLTYVENGNERLIRKTEKGRSIF